LKGRNRAVGFPEALHGNGSKGRKRLYRAAKR
jgi:hypothetical protein